MDAINAMHAVRLTITVTVAKQISSFLLTGSSMMFNA